MGFVGWLQGYGNNFIIAFVFSSEEIANYTFVLGFGAVLQLFANGLNQVWSPKFFTEYKNGRYELFEQSNSTFYNAQCIGLGMLGFTILVSYQSILGLIGAGLSHYSQLHLELCFIFGVYLISAPWWQASNYFMVSGQSRVLFLIVSFSALVGFPLWILLMLSLDSIGIYLGYFLNLAIRSVVIVYYAKRRWHIKPPTPGIIVGLLFLYMAYSISI